MELIDLIITIVLTVIGLIVGAFISYIYLIKSTEKKIEYEITNYELITEALSEKLSQTPTFRILSGEESISSLTSSIIRIENTGFNALKSDDLTPEHPIRITVNKDKKNNNTRIYFAQIINLYGVDNNFDLITNNSIDNTTQNTQIEFYQLLFHHINRGEGVKIRVFHSGKNEDDLSITGAIVNGPPISKKPEWKKDDSKNSLIATISVIITYAAFTILFFFFVPSSLVASLGLGILLFVIIMVALLVSILIIQKLLYKVQGSLRKYVYKREIW